MEEDDSSSEDRPILSVPLDVATATEDQRPLDVATATEVNPLDVARSATEVPLRPDGSRLEPDAQQEDLQQRLLSLSLSPQTGPRAHQVPRTTSSRLSSLSLSLSEENDNKNESKEENWTDPLVDPHPVATYYVEGSPYLDPFEFAASSFGRQARLYKNKKKKTSSSTESLASVLGHVPPNLPCLVNGHFCPESIVERKAFLDREHAQSLNRTLPSNPRELRLLLIADSFQFVGIVDGNFTGFNKVPPLGFSMNLHNVQFFGENEGKRLVLGKPLRPYFDSYVVAKVCFSSFFNCFHFVLFTVFVFTVSLFKVFTFVFFVLSSLGCRLFLRHQTLFVVWNLERWTE